MGKTLPTEESLGLTPSDEELSTAVVNDDDADIPLDSEPEAAIAPAQPGQPDKQTASEPEAEGDEPPGEKPTEEPKQVDVRALQEARAEAREARQRASILEQRWNDFLAYQQAPRQQEQAQPEKPAIPDLDDPQAVLAWARDELVGRSEREREASEQQQQHRVQQQAFQQAFDRVNADYSAASKADPQIAEAHVALRQSLGAELLAMGYAPGDAAREVTRLENQHLVYVAQNGLRIGDYIKALAGTRGWKPAAAAQPKKTDVAAVAAAQQRHMSLSEAGGGEAIEVLDAKALGKMSDKQFAAWMSKRGNEAKFDEIMGKA